MIPNLIVPVLNRYDLLEEMVASIDYPVGRLLIIDNGGNAEDPPAYLSLTRHVERATVLRLPSNLGVASSWNLGVKLLPHEPVWYFTSNDVVFEPGGLENLAKARPDQLTLSAAWPHWQTFALGEGIVRRVGLFDERLYPAYFEDNDYLARCTAAGADTAVTLKDIPATHRNSSTLNADDRFRQRNTHTYQANGELYRAKVRDGDTSWGWDLDRRRAGEWLIEERDAR